MSATIASVIAIAAWLPAVDTTASPVTHARSSAVRAANPSRAVPAHPRAVRAHPSRAVVPVHLPVQLVELDRHARTAYVSSDEGDVSVVDIAHCNLRRRGSCGAPIASLPGPAFGAGLAIYRHTLYVASASGDGAGAVSAYDITRCHTGDTSGCGPAIASVPVAGIPVGLALNHRTHTLYVGNVDDHVDLLDLSSCRQGALSGCAHAVRGSIAAADGPIFPSVDPSHATLYVPANGPGGDGSGTRVHVIDTRRCRAADTSGCGAAQGELPAGAGALVAVLDATSHTLYVASQGDNTVSVLAVVHCTGRDRSGCDQTPAAVPAGAGAGVGGIVETRDRRIYVGNGDSDTLSTFDTRHCRAGHTSGCPTSPPPTLRTGQLPFWLAYDPRGNTIFSTDHVDQALEALDPTRCGASARGCRHLLPTIAGHQQVLADDATHTWYGSDEDQKLTLTDTRVCTARHAGRCAAAAIHTGQTYDGFVNLVADDSTHTLFLILNDRDTFAGSLIAIDMRTCNVRVHTDCSPVAPPMPIPNSYVNAAAINTSTHTVYLTTQDDSALEVVDGARCNALRQTACGAPAGEVSLAGRVYWAETDPVTDTIYVSEFGDDFSSNRVYVIDGRHCRAGDMSGCGRTPGEFRTDSPPLGLVVDDANHSLYVLNNGGGDVPGTVGVYDTRTCNARALAGCARSVVSFGVARAPYVAGLDPVTQQVFVADFNHASLNVIDARACNATRTDGCRDRRLDVGDLPAGVAIDPATHSLFAFNGLYSDTSYLDTRRTVRHAPRS